uniref:Putative RNA polymerase II, Rpb4 n=1 Tax=Helianthus annuus TaxID=4232 RepID=A0A251VL01_HELAN
MEMGSQMGKILARGKVERQDLQRKNLHKFCSRLKKLPENAKCLMNCEAAQILQGIQDHMVLLSKDPTIKIPSSFDRALQYANTGNFYTDPQSVRQVLESLKKQDVSDGEICVIANTGIDTTEKAFALMPSLKAKQIKVIEPLSAALTELTKLKESTIVLD